MRWVFTKWLSVKMFYKYKKFLAILTFFPFKVNVNCLPITTHKLSKWTFLLTIKVITFSFYIGWRKKWFLIHFCLKRLFFLQIVDDTKTSFTPCISNYRYISLNINYLLKGGSPADHITSFNNNYLIWWFVYQAGNSVTFELFYKWSREWS